MRAELANLNNCAVLFLSRAAVNLSWYDSISKCSTIEHIVRAIITIHCATCTNIRTRIVLMVRRVISCL